ncbi:hypothetical protein GQ607_016384 [Colletotrichum asianum]|uniref:Uncharacterized protein n=1 Tax=Colletotrichum asianum TaxID=702518 RepID=A0A8H3VVX9_9PEZI|nr:hypothetical protein GQ607_016384 [Colletotrichum asianum]
MPPPEEVITTHDDDPKLPKPLEKRSAQIVTAALEAKEIYPALRKSEEDASALHGVQPVDLRASLSPEEIDIIVTALPPDLLVTKFSAKVNKACKLWKIPSSRTLFQIGYDFARQGQKFFVAVGLLVSPRSALLPLFAEPSRDVRHVAWLRKSTCLESVSTTPFLPRKPAPAKLQRSRLRSTPPFLGTLLSIEREVKPQSTPLQNAGAEALQTEYSLASHPQTPWTHLTTHQPPKHASRKTLFASEDDEQAEPGFTFPDDERSQNVLDPLENNESLQSSSDPSAHEFEYDPLQPAPEPCASGPGDHDTFGVSATPKLPKIKMAEPSAKRPCLREMSPQLDNGQLAEVLQDGAEIPLKLRSGVIFYMFQMAGDTAVIQTDMLEGIDDADYTPDMTIVDQLFQRTTVFLPLQVGHSDAALGVIHHSSQIADNVQPFGQFEEDGSLSTARNAIEVFIAKYLPKTTPRGRLPALLPGLCAEDPNDMPVYVFAFGAFMTTKANVPPTIHKGLWRRIFYGLLGVTIPDWESLLPHIDDVNVREEPPQPPQLSPEEEVELQNVQELLRQYTAARSALERRHTRNIGNIEKFHHDIAPALKVMKRLYQFSCTYAAQVKENVDRDTERRSYRCGVSSPIQRLEEPDNAEKLQRTVKSVFDKISGLDKRVDDMYMRWVRPRDGLVKGTGA